MLKLNLSTRSVMAAALLVFSYPPFSVWPLAFLAFVVFAQPLVASNSEFFKLSASKRFGYFFGMMLLVYAGGFYWLAHTLHEFGNLNWAVATLATLGILAMFSLPFSILGLLGTHVHVRWLSGKSLFIKSLFWMLLFAVWDFVEPKAFPWSPVKAVGADRILLASVGILKTTGWKILYWAFQLYLLNELQNFSFKHGKVRFRVLGVSALLLVFGFSTGLWQISRLKKVYTETQPVALIQGNVGNYEKKLVRLGVMPTVKNVMNIHRDLIEKAAIKLSQEQGEPKKEPWIVWPETSFPGFPLVQSDVTEDLARWIQLTRGIHLVGAYENAPFEYGGVRENKDYNMVAFFHSKKGYIGHYQKRVRMPLGEYIPGEDWWPQAYNYFPVNHFGRGRELTLLVHPDPNGPVFIPVICYEVLKESLLNDFMKEVKNKYPGRNVVLLNPSNDSWYGDTSEPFHHSLLSRWESARLEIPMLRPTNTGMSQVVAPWGEVLFSGPRNESLVIFGGLPVKKAVVENERL